MKAVSHDCRLSNQTHPAADNGGQPGPESGIAGASGERLRRPGGTMRFDAALETLGRCEVGITTLLLLAES
jgi:hypothetical protein